MTMKKLVYVIALVFIATGFTSCKKIKSWFDVDVKTTMSGDLEIEVEETPLKSAGAYKFDSYFPINPMDYGDVADNEDRIERITADSILAVVEYVSTSEIVLFAKTTSITLKNSEKSVTWTFGNDLLIQKGTEFTLDNIGNIYDDVNDILTSMDVFTVSAEGTASEPGAIITIRIDIKTTITGNPF